MEERKLNEERKPVRLATAFSGADAVGCLVQTDKRFSHWVHQSCAELPSVYGATSVLKERFPNTENKGDVCNAEGIKENEENVDVLVMGPPCVGMSKLGKQRGIADHRTWLTFEGILYGQRLGAKVIVIENVIDLVRDSRFRSVFNRVKGLLAELGYFVQWAELSPDMFGLPFRRPRVYLVAVFGDRRPLETIFNEPFPGRKVSSGTL